MPAVVLASVQASRGDCSRSQDRMRGPGRYFRRSAPQPRRGFNSNRGREGAAVGQIFQRDQLRMQLRRPGMGAGHAHELGLQLFG